MSDLDLNWQAFDAARGSHPRQPGGAQAAAISQSNPAIPLSAAAQAQVAKIQRKAGLPATGQLDPATIAFVQANYNTSGSGGSSSSGGGKQKVSQDGGGKTAASKHSAGTQTNIKQKRAAVRALRDKNVLLREKVREQRVAINNVSREHNEMQRAQNQKARGIAREKSVNTASRQQNEGKPFNTSKTTASGKGVKLKQGANIGVVGYGKTTVHPGTVTQGSVRTPPKFHSGNTMGAPVLKPGAGGSQEAKHRAQANHSGVGLIHARARVNGRIQHIVIDRRTVRKIREPRLHLSNEGNDMTTDLAFNGKKAAPFVKGGKRKKSAVNDAHGRKRAKAKAKAMRMRTHDNANVDLGIAKWHHGWVPANAAAEALKEGDKVRERERRIPGDDGAFHPRHGKIVSVGAADATGVRRAQVKWNDGSLTSHDTRDIEKRSSRTVDNSFNPTEHRDKNGRWNRLAGLMHATGGFTHDIHNDSEPTSGFSVAVPSPGGKDWRELPHGSTSASDIASFAADHADELAKPNRGIGGWSNGDPKEGKVRDALDIVEVHHGIGSAAKAAAKGNQDGIFDLKSFDYISTKDAAERAAKIKRAQKHDMAITPGGRVGDARPLARPGYKGPRKTTDYEREIAHALMTRRGIPKGRAIAMARGLTNKAAKTGRWGKSGKASPAVRAGAAASVAQRASFSNDADDWSDADLSTVDLADARGGTWHHGYIPTNPIAVAEKDHKIGSGGKITGTRKVKAVASTARKSSARKYHTTASRKAASDTELKAHAADHTRAAHNAKTTELRKKHASEANKATRELNRRKAVAAPKNSSSSDKRSVGGSQGQHVAGAEKDLTSQELVQEVKNAKAAGDDKRLTVLKREIAHRLADHKKTQAHMAKAQELIDTDWDKASKTKAGRHGFFNKLRSMLPSMKKQLNAEEAKENADSKLVPDRRTLKQFLKDTWDPIKDELPRIFANHIIGALIAGGAIAAGSGLTHTVLSLMGGNA